MNPIRRIPKIHFLFLAAFVTAFTGLNGAVSVVSNDAAWPTDAVVDTGAPGITLFTQELNTEHILDYDGERDVKGQRPIMQSFDLPANVAKLDVTDLYVYYWGGNTNAPGVVDDVQILIFELDDVFTASIPADDDITTNPPPNAGNGGVPIFSDTITVGPASVDIVGEKTRRVLHLSVSGLTLVQRPGDAGYGIMLYNPDTDGLYPFKWSCERDPYIQGNNIDRGPYALGRPYSDNPGSFQEYHDLSLAIGGTATPAIPLIRMAGTDTGTATVEVATGHFTTHKVETSTDLAPASWSDSVTDIEGDGTFKQVEVSRTSDKQFYRTAEQ